MGKPNPMVLLMNAKQEILHLQMEVERMKGFTLQQSLDMALIALHHEFHFGPKYCARFEKAFRETFLAYAEMCMEDSADDEEIVYTKEKVDRALRAACGEDILPFDERYRFDQLALWGRDLAEKGTNGG